MIVLSIDELALLSFLSWNGRQPRDHAVEMSLRVGHEEPHMDVLKQYGLLLEENAYLDVSDGVRLIFRELWRRGIDPKALPDGREWLAVQPRFESREFNRDSKLCFVLMPFTKKWSDRIWKKIKTIVGDVGMKCMRADDLYGENVMEDVWHAINSADVVIADMTGRNPNVFYELGMSHTVGGPTILLSQSEDDIPFDLNAYRCVLYEDNADGYELLEKGIRGMIEDIRSGVIRYQRT